MNQILERYALEYRMIRDAFDSQEFSDNSFEWRCINISRKTGIYRNSIRACSRSILDKLPYNFERFAKHFEKFKTSYAIGDPKTNQRILRMVMDDMNKDASASNNITPIKKVSLATIRYL